MIQFMAKSDMAPREAERTYQFTVDKITNLKKYRLVTLNPTPKGKWWEKPAPLACETPRCRDTRPQPPRDGQTADGRRRSVTQTDINNRFVNFSPIEFEGIIAVLFRAKGYRAFATRALQDDGIDVVASRGSTKTVVQVKKWNSNVGGPDVLKTIGARATYGARRAIVISTSGFTKQALEFENKNRDLELWDWNRTKSEFCRYIVEKPPERAAGQPRTQAGRAGTNQDRKRAIPKKAANKNSRQRNQRHRRQHARRPPDNKGRRR